MAVGAMRNGAYDFMEKPSPERLVDVAIAPEQRGWRGCPVATSATRRARPLEGRIIAARRPCKTCAN